MIRFLNQFNYLIINAIHLCRRLSVRAIQLFNICNNIKSILLAPCCLPPKASKIIRIGPLNHINISKKICVCDIKKSIAIGIVNNSGNEKQSSIKFTNTNINKDNKTDCNCLTAFNLVSIEKNTNLNKLIQKIDMTRNSNKYQENKENKENDDKLDVFVELLPRDLIQSIKDIDDRYWNWISFLYNGINVECHAKRMFKIPLHGGSHRCDCYIIASK